MDFNEESMDIRVSYWADGNVRYDGIRSVTYRDDISTGSRTGGLGTPRLQAGISKTVSLASICFTLIVIASIMLFWKQIIRMWWLTVRMRQPQNCCMRKF